MNLRVLAGANADVTEALTWLATRRRYGVLRSLWLAWLAAQDAIEAAPRLYPPAEDPGLPDGIEVRNYLVIRHGYRVVYAVAADEVVVVAFARTRRSSEHWLSRLADLN